MPGAPGRAPASPPKPARTRERLAQALQQARQDPGWQGARTFYAECNAEVQAALERRGWRLGPPETSRLLWGQKRIWPSVLQDWQVTNHFAKLDHLCSKLGLLRTLKQAQLGGEDVAAFYPRAFDLHDPQDLQDFVAEYRVGKCASILKAEAAAGGRFPPEVVEFALEVLSPHAEDEDDVVDGLVSDEAWALLAPMDLDAPDQCAAPLEAKAQRAADLARRKLLDRQLCEARKQQLQEMQQRRQQKKKAKAAPSLKLVTEDLLEELKPVPRPARPKQALAEAVARCCARLSKEDPQFGMSGTRHAWILKPADRMRGEGIELMRDLEQIQSWGRSRRGQTAWVVQKYVEDALCGPEGNKFDVRQWVVVASWEPLEVYFWDSPYARFCAEKYDPDAFVTRDARGELPGGQDVRWKHLTNNPVTATSANFDADDEDRSFMWDAKRTAEFIDGKFGKHAWRDRVIPQFEHIILTTLRAAQGLVQARPSCLELVGFDLLISEECRVWLLEVQHSPSTELSTGVTKRLVPQVCADLVALFDARFGGAPKEPQDLPLDQLSDLARQAQPFAVAERFRGRDQAPERFGQLRRLVRDPDGAGDCACFGMHGPKALLVQGKQIKLEAQAPKEEQPQQLRQAEVKERQQQAVDQARLKRTRSALLRQQQELKAERARQTCRDKVLRRAREHRLMRPSSATRAKLPALE